MTSERFRPRFSGPGGNGHPPKPVVSWLVAAVVIAVLGATVGRGEDRLTEAAALRAGGRFEAALDVLRAESRRVKEAEGDDSPRLLPINDLAAEILIDKGDAESIDKAATLLKKTIETRRKLIDAGRREQAAGLAGALLTKTRLEVAARRLPDAVEAACQAMLVFDGAEQAEGVARARQEVQSAVAALDALLGPAAEATRRARDGAADTFVRLGMFPDAIAQRQAILDGLLAGGGVDPAAIRAAGERLGWLMLTAGRASEAVPIVERCLVVLPAKQAEAVSLRRTLGELELAAGQFVRAGGSFTTVLEEAKALPRPSPWEEAGDRLRSLLVDVRRGAVGRLPEWFEQAVKTLQQSAPADAAVAVPGLLMAGRLRQRLGDPAAAVQVFNVALAKSSDAGGVADASASLAAAHLAAGDVAAAKKIAEPALPIAEKALGPGDGRVTLLRIILAAALHGSGSHDRANNLAAEALRRPLPRPDDDWEELATTVYDRLAEGPARNGAGPRDLRDRYVAARAAQFGDGHPHVAAACGMFGAERLAAGDWAAASDFFSRAIEMQRAGGGEHPELAANLVLLAHAERAAGDLKRAEDTAARGLAAWERLAGPNHDGTLTAAEVLVTARLEAGETTGVAQLLERLVGSGQVDAARQAMHLVQLADFLASHDKARAVELLQRALQLPCWSDAAVPTPADRRRLACTAALAAHAYAALGDVEAGRRAVQRARGLAMEAKNPKPLLDHVDRLAARGERRDPP